MRIKTRHLRAARASWYMQHKLNMMRVYGMSERQFYAGIDEHNRTYQEFSKRLYAKVPEHKWDERAAEAKLHSGCACVECLIDCEPEAYDSREGLCVVCQSIKETATPEDWDKFCASYQQRY
jgi:hypothetical protein